MNTFKDKLLTIEPNTIKMENGETVMHSWEKSIMELYANFVCSNGGHILELGFGLGLSATAIQAHNIKSHTICEIHPQIIEYLKDWAKDKPNVIILEGDWFDNVDKMKKYDGILYDTHQDPHSLDFKNIIPKIANNGCRITWWNNKNMEHNGLKIKGTKFNKIKISPPKNTYFNHSTYWMPQYTVSNK